jgi:hypothetical protein
MVIENGRNEIGGQPPSADNIKMARFIAGAIGFGPHVHPYYDEDESHKLSVLSLVDPIDHNVSIYCTIGLSDSENKVEVKGAFENIPVELFMTGYKKFDKVSNVLSTTGFFIMKDKYECRPGAVFKYMIDYYYKGLTMRHAYFTSPFLWQEKLDQLELDSKKVSFLMIIPISDAELDYKIQHGDDALENLLQDNEIDFYDLNRPSVV